jgi:hypothetical protein
VTPATRSQGLSDKIIIVPQGIPERDISALVADAARVIVGFDAEPCANWASVSLLWPDR